MNDEPGFKEFTINDSGWLASDTTFPDLALWVPLERRGSAIASFGRRVVVGGKTGAVTILELPGERGYSFHSEAASGAEHSHHQLNRMLQCSNDMWCDPS
jgi:hypothetical protein